MLVAHGYLQYGKRPSLLAMLLAFMSANGDKDKPESNITVKVSATESSTSESSHRVQGGAVSNHD